MADDLFPHLSGLEKARAVRDHNAQLRREGKLPPLDRKSRAAKPATPSPRVEPAPAVPVTQTPEFQAAVSAALASMIPAIIGQLEEARARVGESSGQDQPGDRFWAEKLAAQIALANDPAKPILSPEETASRAAGRERLLELLVDAKATGNRPIYTLVSKVVLDIPGQGSTLIEPLQRGSDNRVRPSRIIHWDIPNEAMRPANEPAAEIHDAFLQSIGGRQSGGSFKVDGTEFPVPPNGGYIETNYSLTAEGKAIVGLGAAQIASSAHHEQQRKARYGGVLLDENDDPASLNNSGPPYVDVNVLGTIAPPARQNG